MKIYDCFTFFNEFDLLELRLKELYDHVDHFVLVEGNTTFTNIEKPYYFEENQQRFAPYLDKIIHVRAQMPKHADAWANETFQRNSINDGIVDANEDDIVIISDIDEIPRPSVVDSMREDADVKIWGLRTPLFYFKFNHMLVTGSVYTTWIMAGRAGVMMPADDFRRQRFALNGFPLNHNADGIRLVEHAGWHFSYLGDAEFVATKIRSFSHTETNRPDVIDNIDLERSIADGNGLGPSPAERFVGITLDDYFPQTVVRNPEQYTKYISTNTTNSAWDFLPRL